MSDSLIAFHPAIEEPSNIVPSSKISSSIIVWSKVTCCSLPRGSVKRRSTYLMSSSLILLRMSLPVVISLPLSQIGFLFVQSDPDPPFRRQTLESVVAGFAGPYTDGLFDRIDENLAVADATGLRRTADRLDRLLGEVIRANYLDFHLGQKVDDIFGAAIEFRVALLTAKALGFGDGDALQANFLQRFFDFVELERLYDSLDLFHFGLHIAPCTRGRGQRARHSISKTPSD